MIKLAMLAVVVGLTCASGSAAQGVTQNPFVEGHIQQQGQLNGTSQPLQNNYIHQPIIIMPDRKLEPEGATEHGQKRSDYEEDSLNVQKDIAQANSLSATYSFLQAYLSGIGAILLLATLMVSFWTARETRRIGQASVRAYLTVTPEDISDIIANQPLTAEFAIKNQGNSPAYDMNYIAAIFVSEPKEVNFRDDLVRAAIQPYPLGKTITTDSETRGEAITSSVISQVELQEITKSHAKVIHLAGHVYYRDVFKRSHHIKFCYVFKFVTVTPDGLKQYAWHLAHYHNETT